MKNKKHIISLIMLICVCTIKAQNNVILEALEGGVEIPTVVMCDGKTWMSHNLGADYTLNPNIPVAGIHGAKYQWGRLAPALTQVEANTNSGSIVGWNITNAPNAAWGNSKTSNDPCPAGFKVPTQVQWQALTGCASVSTVGNFANDGNFTSAFVFSSGTNSLTLPYTGKRDYLTGSMTNRGGSGWYWSSTEINNDRAFLLLFVGNSFNPTHNELRTAGQSIRCIAE
ncbi:fibrobacter succinogenes major paralogous domain-containing protein [Chryseobacterium potabilaquae]|uniref:Uncharacterized protein n=1 Tax=Chryseobacterium potabilaquae TaxID=2675057 RepID=A0A6N4XCD1_9FLAO|nr:FISUMP domain-containing protein [Chryseobacterium potabilaquae]CAA7197409.1 hypothetical protein CHRY9293_03468 [Chryseobacterium potabilaquae]